MLRSSLPAVFLTYALIIYSSLNLIDEFCYSGNSSTCSQTGWKNRDSYFTVRNLSLIIDFKDLTILNYRAASVVKVT